MIAEYKLYQGAVLAELVDESKAPLQIDEFIEDGRLHSYVVNGSVGLHVKHSTARLPPWQFSFTQANRKALSRLTESLEHAFVVLTCWVDGIVALNHTEWATLLGADLGVAGWIRATRRRRGQYTLSGSGTPLLSKKAHGLSSVLEVLAPIPPLPSRLQQTE